MMVAFVCFCEISPLTDAPKAYEEIQNGKAKVKKVIVF